MDDADRMRDVLTAIADRRLPDQPADTAATDAEWARFQYDTLRAMAKTALLLKPLKETGNG